MATKVTKKDMFTRLMTIEEVREDAEMMAFITHEIELINKKASSKKPTKVQKANIELIDKVVEVLEAMEKPVTITEIIATKMLGEISNQKCTAIMKKLVDGGTVAKKLEKGKSLFYLPKELDEVDNDNNKK